MNKRKLKKLNRRRNQEYIRYWTHFQNDELSRDRISPSISNYNQGFINFYKSKVKSNYMFICPYKNCSLRTDCVYIEK